MVELSSPPSVLALNCGSSSLKFGLYRCGSREPELLCEGEAEEIGSAEARFWSAAGKRTETKREIPDFEAALAIVREALNLYNAPEPTAIGHRFVHGGPELREHEVWTERVQEQLRTAAEFAPLHVPAALHVLAATQRQYAGVPQVICLDTAFHRTLLDVSQTLAVPLNLRERGVARYGFHGISLESIVQQLQPVPRRLIVAHLGNGASITAIEDGRSVDTSMAFTPNAGVLMGTRCGDLDPGVTTYAMRHLHLDADRLDDLLNHQAGLLGVSETSSDVRELEKVRATDMRADLALRMFCWQVRKSIAGMAAVLGGVDLLVFTGGIGEHDEAIRRDILDGLKVLGSLAVRTLPSQEDLQIARVTVRLSVSGDSRPSASADRIPER